MNEPAPAVHRVLPNPADIDSMREAAQLDRPPHDHRPWVALCMVASLDGSVAVDGTSGGLGNANDIDVLSTLRSMADAILVGASTVSQEDYGAPKRPNDLYVVATNSGNLPYDSGLFRSGQALVLAPERAIVDETRVRALRAGTHQLDLAAGLTALRNDGVAHLHAEGGPRLNGALFADDLIDEVDLTISPNVAGGDGARLAVGGTEQLRRFTLDQLLVDDDGFLFGRWLRTR